jgi:hypothetical protein
MTKARLLEMAVSVDDGGDRFVTQHKRKDESLYNFKISSSGTIYRGRKLIFFIHRDITERKQVESGEYLPMMAEDG